MHWHCSRGLHQDTNISPPGTSNEMSKSQQRRKVAGRVVKRMASGRRQPESD